MIIIFAGFRLFARLCDCVCDSQSASVRRGSSAARERPAGRRPAPGRRRRGEERTLLFCPSNLEKAMAAGAAAARGLARGCLAETRPSFGVTFCDCVSCCTAVHDMQQKNRARQRMCGRIARRMRAGRPPGGSGVGGLAPPLEPNSISQPAMRRPTRTRWLCNGGRVECARKRVLR